MAGNLSPKLDWKLANPLWASTLNPALTNLENLMNIPMLSGVQLGTITLVASTPKKVPHGLGAVPTGWFLVDNTANSVVWRTAWTNQTITLEASANTTIQFWCY